MQTVDVDENAEIAATDDERTEAAVRRWRDRDGVRFGTGWAVGALVAALLFVQLLTAGTFDFARRMPFSDNFYDVQAERLFDGQWDMPLNVVAI